MIDRNESLRDQIATIVQAGYSQRKTSVETADEIRSKISLLSIVTALELKLAEAEKDSADQRECPECGRNVDEFGDCYHRDGSELIGGREMSDNKPCQATPAATLREQIMDSRIAKSEREWWAARTIEQLERELAEARKEIWNTISAMAEMKGGK